jgi:peptidoglycan-associated lipoprotein
MRQRFLNILCIALFSLISFNINAQQNFLDEANEAFENREYFNSIALYKKAYAKERRNEVKALILFKTAECYRQVGDNPQAEVWYSKAIDANYPDPKAVLYYADALKEQGKNAEAKVQYQKYKSLNPSDPRGDTGVKSSEIANEWTSKPTRWKVENLSMINTKDREFCPMYADSAYKKIYFTSTRSGATGGEFDATIGEAYSDVFEATVDNNGKWSTPTPLAAPVTTKNNEGLTSITKKGDLLFWTRCIPEKNKIVYNQLWSVPRQGDNKWGTPEKLPFNNDTTKFASPAISPDGKMLVFASNLTGGYGDNDLWISKYDAVSNTWSVPINLGPEINTVGNDAFPYIKDDMTLYYSTNGRIGMGGRDIFKAEYLGDGKWGKVENMQYPINSNADDFGIIFEGVSDRGYMSSNREGTKGSDDLWSVVLPPLLFAAEGVVMTSDPEFKEPVPGVKVILRGSDGSTITTLTDKDGKYSFAETTSGERPIKPNTSYTVSLSVDKDLKTAHFKNGFLNSSAKYKFSTVGERESKVYKGGELDLLLIPIKKEIAFPAVLYDVGKSDLRPESKDSLDYLYQTLIDNPNIVIELSAHTDSRGDNDKNLKLSQDRAQSCYDYLVSKGIPADRMIPKGYGEERLLVTDKQISMMKTLEEIEAAHQKNRRTVFSVLRKDYVPKN